MPEHRSSDELKKELDAMLSKINALETIASDEFQKGMVKVARRLAEGQIHSLNEFEHLKKAIDIITLEMFEIKNKQNSRL
jgi:hypothetical protein